MLDVRLRRPALWVIITSAAIIGSTQCQINSSIINSVETTYRVFRGHKSHPRTIRVPVPEDGEYIGLTKPREERRALINFFPIRYGHWQLQQKAADLEVGGVSIASSDDVYAGTRVVGVGRNRFVGFEVQIALDRKTEYDYQRRSAHRGIK